MRISPRNIVLGFVDLSKIRLNKSHTLHAVVGQAPLSQNRNSRACTCSENTQLKRVSFKQM
jgi:hypothetical protein